MPWITPPDIATGDIVKAQAVGAELYNNMKLAVHLLAVKSASTPKTSDATVAADTELQVVVGANELWYLDFWVNYNSAVAGTGNIKFTILAPSDSRISFGAAGFDTIPSGYVVQWDTPAEERSFYANTTMTAFNIRGVVYTLSNSGTVSLGWAQNTSSGNATTLRVGSNIKGLKLGPNPRIEQFTTP